MRLSVVPVLGFVLAMGCEQSSPLAPSQSGPSFKRHEITRTDDKDSGTFELRLDRCLGERIIVTGSVRFKEHRLTDVETRHEDHTKVSFFSEGTAVGQQTGRVWKYKDISQLTFNTPNLLAPQGEFSSWITAHLVSRGKQPNATIRLQLHFTTGGNGAG